MKTGTVIRTAGNIYDVLSDGQTLRCRIRGRLRLKDIRTTNPVAVGDEVGVSADAAGEWSIESVSPRRNYVIRRASNLSKESHIIAANVDRALLLVSLHSPATPTEFVDRFLVTCEAYGVPVTVLLAKCDLLDDMRPQAEQFMEVYRNAGYEVIEVSALRGDGMERVASILGEGTTLLSGNSGVGKSTLVGAVCPGVEIRTGEVSASHLKGRHTTTYSTMYMLPSGGRIIDTPGIKGFGLIDLEDVELRLFFPELRERGEECRFRNCTHTREPGCAVVPAVERGEIAYQRYESYLKMLDEDGKYRK